VDLRDEHAALDEMLSALDGSQWALPTPAVGWTVADQLRHLTASERAAEIALRGRGDDLFRGEVAITPVEERDPDALLRAWRAAREKTLQQLATTDDRAKVVWGAGPMSARSFADARLMETWAHGLDCFAAVGEVPVDTPRLRRIASLALRALPYAFRVAREEPPGDVRSVALDLVGTVGDEWWIGPEASEDVIAGSASEWCRVATRRLRPKATSLRTTTPLAAASLRVARAYLDDT